MTHTRAKYIIFSVTCLAHCLILIWLLVFYTSSPREFNFGFYDPLPSVAETVFYNEPSSTPSTSPSLDTPAPQQSSTSDWGQLNAAAGKLSNSMDMIDQGIDPTLPDNLPLGDDPHATDSDSSESVDTTQEKEQSTGSSSLLSSDVAGTLFISPEKADMQAKKAQERAKKQQAQKIMAGIARNYIDQLQNNGSDLVQTVGGDPNKKPTAQQLKEQQYVAKIIWCLQNARSILSPLTLTERLETTIYITLILDQNGKKIDLKITRSSGNRAIDDYFMKLFEYASSSFPPLPSYIQAPYTIPFYSKIGIT